MLAPKLGPPGLIRQATSTFSQLAQQPAVDQGEP